MIGSRVSFHAQSKAQGRRRRFPTVAEICFGERGNKTAEAICSPPPHGQDSTMAHRNGQAETQERGKCNAKTRAEGGGRASDFCPLAPPLRPPLTNSAAAPNFRAWSNLAPVYPGPRWYAPAAPVTRATAARAAGRRGPPSSRRSFYSSRFWSTCFTTSCQGILFLRRAGRAVPRHSSPRKVCRCLWARGGHHPSASVVRPLHPRRIRARIVAIQEALAQIDSRP